MGRPREFDAEEALERALRIFWKQGYGGTSLPDLEKAMAIGRTSIYGAFGDKEALFLAALDLYAERHMQPHLDALMSTTNVRAAIRTHFKALLAFLTNPRLPLGCLLTNVATECDRGASPIGRKLAALIGRNESAFYKLLRNGQATGEVGPFVDPRAVARYFAMTIQGLSVMAKAYSDSSMLYDIVDRLFATLDSFLGPESARSPAAREEERLEAPLRRIRARR
jgi:TetR/AcrR family transcriptional regulator, transcriptional repressor for nem operon